METIDKIYRVIYYKKHREIVKYKFDFNEFISVIEKLQNRGVFWTAYYKLNEVWHKLDKNAILWNIDV